MGSRRGSRSIGGRVSLQEPSFIPCSQVTKPFAPSKPWKVYHLETLNHSNHGPSHTGHTSRYRVGNSPKTGVLSEILYTQISMITGPLPPLNSHNRCSQIYSLESSSHEKKTEQFTRKTDDDIQRPSNKTVGPD